MAYIHQKGRRTGLYKPAVVYDTADFLVFGPGKRRSIHRRSFVNQNRKERIANLIFIDLAYACKQNGRDTGCHRTSGETLGYQSAG